MEKFRIYVIVGFSILLTSCNSGGVTPYSQSNLTNSESDTVLIQNGVPVTTQAINAMVPLIYIQESNGIGEVCSGTLLDPNTILTAAHCVLDLTDKQSGKAYSRSNIISESSIMVVMPKNLSLAVDINNDSPQTISDWNIYHISSLFVHNDALLGADISNGILNVSEESQLNDLAILKLTTSVDKQYQFANLATKNPVVGTQEIIVGYGVDNGNGVIVNPVESGNSGILRMAFSKVSSVVASGSYLQVGGIISSSNVYTKTCQGDSGGPDLLTNADGSYTITGVHSFGIGSSCGVSNLPGNSISVAYYNQWISGGYNQNHL